jgi:Flp pilus assembly pilin Flp
MNCLKRFQNDETGAVTVDWVVLTAGVVVLAIVVAPPIQRAVGDMAVLIADQLGIAQGWLSSVPD